MISSKCQALGIIKRSSSRKIASNWLGQLEKKERKLVDELVTLLVIHNDVPLKTIARNLINDLGLNRNPETIVRTLKELIANAQKSK